MDKELQEKHRAYIQQTFTAMIDRDQAWQLQTMKDMWANSVAQDAMTQETMDQKVADFVAVQAARRAKLITKYMSHYGGEITTQ